MTEVTQLTTSGTLTVTGPDAGQAEFVPMPSAAGTYGTFAVDANGHWSYQLDNANPQVQALRATDQVSDTLTVSTKDGTTQQITITVNGTNDAAVITGQDTGAVMEDTGVGSSGRIIIDGKLDVTDVDTGEAAFTYHGPFRGALNGQYGTLGAMPDGQWQYSADNAKLLELGKGETVTDTLTITSKDGTTHDIVITLTGTNDDPVLGVSQSSPTAGTLTQTDVDTGDTHTFSVTQGAGQFGTLTVVPSTGAYTYTPSGSVQGMTLDPQTGTYSGIDTFEVQVTDNHGGTDTQYITFTPTGTVTAPAQPGGQPTVATSVPANPVVSNTAPGAAAGVSPMAPVGNFVTIDLAAASDTGSSATDHLTGDTTPTITGTTTIPFSKVEILEGTKVIATTYSDANGDYSVDAPALTGGAHSLVAQATGPAETTPAASNALDLTIDTSAPAPTLSIDSVTPDDVLNAAEAGQTIAITGTVGGEFSAGDTVTLSVNGKDFTGSVDAVGKFSIDVPGADLKADPNTQIEGSVTATDAAGNSATATATHGYTLTITLPHPTLTIDAVTPDNVLNAIESGINLPITGTVGGDFHAGDQVTLSVNGKDFTGSVDARGGFSIRVPGADLQADPNTEISGSVSTSDASGNVGTASATRAYGVDTTAPSVTVSLDPITGDDVINAAEAGGDVAVTGTVVGDFRPGDLVTLTVDGAPRSGHVDAQGRFSIDINGTDLRIDAGHEIHAVVRATDAAGNLTTATATHGYTFDTANHAPQIATPKIAPAVAAHMASGQFAATDSDQGDQLHWSVQDVGQHQQPGGQMIGQYGTFWIDPNSGKWEYDPDASRIPSGATGPFTDSFLVGVTDAQGHTDYQRVDITGNIDSVSLHGKSQQHVQVDAHITGVDTHPFATTRRAADVPLSPTPGVDVQGEERPDLGFTVYHGQPAADTGESPVMLDALNPAAVAPAAEAGGSIAIAGAVTGAYNVGDVVMVNVNGADYQGTVDDGGRFSVDVPGSELQADPDATLEGLLVTTDADGNPQTQGFSEDLGDLLAGPLSGVPEEPAAPTEELADQLAVPAPPPEEPADPLAPYLEMVGADGGGNGGQAPASEAASPYLEALGVTPETASPGQPDTGSGTDAGTEVPAHDAFAASDQTEDQLQAIEGTPHEAVPVEETPLVPDQDLDAQQHG